MIATDFTCPACAAPGMRQFFEVRQVPIHCNVLLHSQEEATQYPKGDMVLGFCNVCGLIYNLAFDPELMNYCPEYENSLAFSPLFSSYLEGLASHLVDKYQLHDKDIIEIGCGKADFLTMLCEIGGNRGVGFDPSYEVTRSKGQPKAQVEIVQDFYSERYASYRGDLVCSRHTLEHVSRPPDMLNTVRRSIGDHRNPITFFEVPNGLFTLQEMAIWDIIYEHCSYFSPGSLTRLFRSCGFEVTNVTEAFDGQFLWVEALPNKGGPADYQDSKEDIEEIAQDVARFAKRFSKKVQSWRRELKRAEQENRRCVVWGAGSKGVSFLNLMNVGDQIKYIVDINPHKEGMYVAGAGQKIVSPEFLKEYRPDMVLVMNSIYQDEIGQQLSGMGIEAELISV